MQKPAVGGAAPKPGHPGLKKQGVAHSVLGKQTEVRLHTKHLEVSSDMLWHELLMVHAIARMLQPYILLGVSWGVGNLEPQDWQKTS